jgi:hypothetical protein
MVTTSTAHGQRYVHISGKLKSERPKPKYADRLMLVHGPPGNVGNSLLFRIMGIFDAGCGKTFLVATLCRLLNGARQTITVTAASNKAVCVIAVEYLKLMQEENPFVSGHSRSYQRSQADRDISNYSSLVKDHRCVLVGVAEAIADCGDDGHTDVAPNQSKSLATKCTAGTKHALKNMAKSDAHLRPPVGVSNKSSDGILAEMEATYDNICHSINGLYYPVSVDDIYVYSYVSRVARILGLISRYLQFIIDSQSKSPGGNDSKMRLLMVSLPSEKDSCNLRKICVECKNLVEYVIAVSPDAYQLYLWNLVMRMKGLWETVFDSTAAVTEVKCKNMASKVVRLGKAPASPPADHGIASSSFAASAKVLLQTVNDLSGRLRSSEVENCVNNEYLAHTLMIFCTLSTSGSRIVRTAGKYAFEDLDKIYGYGFNNVAAKRKTDYLIVDEAAQVLEPELSIGLNLLPLNIVLIGDPQQLPPFVVSTSSSTDPINGAAGSASVSAMQRLMFKDDTALTFNAKSSSAFLDEAADMSGLLHSACGLVGSHMINYRMGVMLNTQYRMHPDILSFPNKLCYDNRLKSCESVETRSNCFVPYSAKRAASSVLMNPDWLRGYAFIDVSNGREQEEGRHSKSLSNAAEADIVVRYEDRCIHWF